MQTEPHVDTSTQADDIEDEVQQRTKKRLSRRDIETNEEIEVRLRKEITEELQSAQKGETSIAQTDSPAKFTSRQWTEKEWNAINSSEDFFAFAERSCKVLERVLDDDYDILADYTRTSTLNDDNDTPNKALSIRQVLQLHSDKYCRRRMVSDIQYSPHFQELLLTSYTKNPTAPHEKAGLVLLWNTHAPSRPEYVFNCASDVVTARFSPFHPNLVLGGCYSGQICLWDTRISGRTGAPVQKTPQSGSHLGHTHSVYNMNVIGTPNAHNIMTASMDGVVCSWSVDMLTQAQEYLTLTSPPPTRTEDLAPTTMSFPASDPTFFLVGTEEGPIYSCHRYDRAGAKAGVDARIAYRGHTAPVMSTQFHPARGPVDLSDLLLSSSSDWTVKLWRIKPAATSNTAAAVAAAASTSGTTTSTTTNTTIPSLLPNTSQSNPAQTSISPLITVSREDLIYDAKWHPHRPSIFGCVTGAGDLEIFDLTIDTEVPVAKAQPDIGLNGSLPFRSLNRLAWEEKRGSHVAVGGLNGIVTIFETGRGLQGGAGEAQTDEWTEMKKVVGRAEALRGL